MYKYIKIVNMILKLLFCYLQTNKKDHEVQTSHRNLVTHRQKKITTTLRLQKLIFLNANIIYFRFDREERLAF